MKTWNYVLDFWFKELAPEDWFKGGENIDQQIKHRFYDTLISAQSGELAHWRETLKGRLAEIIVLDQFSRNIFRGHRKAFENDGMALVLAQEAIKQPDLEDLSPQEKQFLYMPFMHSESILIHEKAIKLYGNDAELQTPYQYEIEHKKIIDRFGRYPYRNEILGRKSTPEEIDWMKTNEGF